MRSPEDALAFKELNEEWIGALFTIEAADRALLDDPSGSIIAHGGDVLVVREGNDAGAPIIGCVALVPTGGDVFELSKMTIAPEARNKGIGRRLIHSAIDRARELGAKSLFLGSSTKLANAVHLYESVGFTHVAPERIGPVPYARADVFMELGLSA
jgi:N-acetylglutamate synthase-like GNAT family acetyltransferase